MGLALLSTPRMHHSNQATGIVGFGDLKAMRLVSLNFNGAGSSDQGSDLCRDNQR